MTDEWFIYDRIDGRELGYRAIVDAEGFTICNPSPMGEDNARLIAAAPDLLHALYTALPFVENALGDPCYKPGAVRKALELIRKAIERAEQ